MALPWCSQCWRCALQAQSCINHGNLCRAALKTVSEDLELIGDDMQDAVDDLLAGNANPTTAKGTSSQSDSDAAPSADGSDGALGDGDYDAMLQRGAASAKTKRSKAAGQADDHHSDSDRDSLSASGDGSDADAVADTRNAAAQQELLPVEDDFLRLADMEQFVQHAEAAEEGGDRGGLDTFEDIAQQLNAASELEGGELGASTIAKGRKTSTQEAEPDNAQTRKRSNAHKRKRTGPDKDESGDEEAALQRALDDNAADADSESDIDLFADFDAAPGAGGAGAEAHSDDDADAEQDGDAIMYEAFFGRNPQHSAGGDARKRARPVQASNQPAGDGGSSDASDSAELDSDGPSEDSDDVEEHDTGAAIGAGVHTGSKALQRKENAACTGAADADVAELSSHQKRQLRVQQQIAEMEEAAMQGADWHMRGEATAAHRPVDSALELDLDFEQTLRPPPQPTMEAAVALEDMIKERICELRFDNVVKVEPAAPAKEKAALEMDDSKSRAGLADLYEGDGGAAARGGGSSAEQKERIRTVCTSEGGICCCCFDEEYGATM